MNQNQSSKETQNSISNTGPTQELQAQIVKKRGKTNEFDYRKVVGEEFEKRKILMAKLYLTDQKLVDKQKEIIKIDNQPDYTKEYMENKLGRQLKTTLITTILQPSESFKKL